MKFGTLKLFVTTFHRYRVHVILNTFNCTIFEKVFQPFQSKLSKTLLNYSVLTLLSDADANADTMVGLYKTVH